MNTRRSLHSFQTVKKSGHAHYIYNHTNILLLYWLLPPNVIVSEILQTNQQMNENIHTYGRRLEPNLSQSSDFLLNSDFSLIPSDFF